ncbi:iron-sulfur cluster assembly accessory protein [Rhodomicrobium vannielii]|jgi:iron-sulfur cluster assembly protein|uniref:HesB/IscA family protein n=1 Tax=Rhodomicrobium vannielii TaxID=1069 RepID=UPI000315C774
MPSASNKGGEQLSSSFGKVVTLTDSAAERVKAIIGRSETPVVGLRVGIKKGGCAGMEYTMEYAAEARPLEEVVEDKGVRILIEPSAILYLLGTEMDYKTEKFVSGFVFKNPNQTSACGCGESVELSPAQTVGE